MSSDYNAKASPERVELTVGAEWAGKRLDQALAALRSRHSRGRLQDWIREGRVSVDGATVRETRKKLWGGETLVVLEAPDARLFSEAPEAIALDIVYEDGSLIVLDKPPALVVHPGSGNWSGTLLNALLFHWPSLKALPRAGIVHRLDKDTSGLMVVAKTLTAQTDLVRQLQAHTVRRLYTALVRGKIVSDGTVDAPIGRHPVLRTRMAVRPLGKAARTHYRVIECFSGCSLVECSLETGRTHQIRVHMAHIGHPLVGDPVYGAVAGRIPAGPAFPRQALHAFQLALNHPETGKTMRWTAALPGDMRQLIEEAGLRAIENREAKDDVRDARGEFSEGIREIPFAREDLGDEIEDEDDVE
ncbi:MAG: 23S rRNA pseudouridine(1911/1915/1917) synthase RluD [Candidatus Accumulibacter sp.]|nr:23S rRNA pseudouridine(1911/1915/1917) synthase RluD [Accumulibacter sp.]